MNTKELSKALGKHPNRCFVSYLIFGLMHGFLAGLSNMPTFSFTCKNLQSAIKDPQAVDDLMDKELEKGYMIGPFDQPPFKLFRINPLGVAVRKYSGKNA